MDRQEPLARRILVPPLSRSSLELAIGTLQTLLDAPEPREEAFQQFFQAHPVAFTVFGAQAVFPKPRLVLPEDLRLLLDKEYLEPDFLMSTHRGTLEVLDLKLPSEKLLVAKHFRERFRSRMDEYISQVANYSTYFDDRAERAAVSRLLGLPVHRSPDQRIVVGRSDSVDLRALHEQARTRTNALFIETYDAVLMQLSHLYDRTRGVLSAAPGFSLGMVIAIGSVRGGRRRFILDCGQSLQQNRCSVFMDREGRICFQIVDANEELHIVRARVAEELVEQRQPFYLWCELKNAGFPTTMSLYINGELHRDLILDETIPLSGGRRGGSLDYMQMCVGSDLRGSNAHGTLFCLFELFIYGTATDVSERVQLIEYVARRYDESGYTRCVEYGEGRFMRRSADGHMVQEESERRPVVRVINAQSET
jgi:hypothetical protein